MVLFYLSSLSYSTAQNNSVGVEVPTDQYESLLIQNTDMRFLDFITAYKGEDLIQRRLAEMYLIGVLDATEGKVWCAYRELKPGSLKDIIYSGFEEHKDKISNYERASKVILSIIVESSSCTAQK